MLTRDSIFVILFSLPVYQLLFYTVQLISFRRKNPSKKYLGLLLLCMTVYLVINALYFLGYHSTFSYLYLVYLPVLLSIVPAYFLYILSITRENHDVNNRQRLIIFSPAIIVLIANLIILGTLEPSARQSLIDQGFLDQGINKNNIPALLIFFWIGAIILMLGQVAFSITRVMKIVKIEKELMRNQPSHLAYLEWKWISAISLSVLLFVVINALIEMIVPLNNLILIIIYNLLMLFAGGVTGYFGMKQDDLLNQVEKVSLVALPVEKDIQADLLQPGKEPSVSFISETEAEEIHKKIIEYLETEKPYIKSNFSMHDLCDSLNISRRKISFVLNEIIRKNFYGVINEFRIREAEDLLMQDNLNQLKIEALGEMVGFQSKSSFNACFKKVTGMTPSEYRLKNRV